MQAHHPITGQEIRILKSECQLHYDKKTLVWIQAGFAPSPRWNRWYTVYSDLDALKVCSDNVTAVILPQDADVDAWSVELLRVLTMPTFRLLLAPSSVLEKFEGKLDLESRALAFEDLYDTYPYLGEPINAGDPLEKVVVSLSHILRMDCVAWTHPSERDQLPLSVRLQYDAWIRTCNGRLTTLDQAATDECIPRVWLIQQYFKHSVGRRFREIHACLERNLECPYIDTVYLLNEQDYEDLPKDNPKLIVDIVPHRLTYYDVFKAIREKVPPNTIVVFSNSDIWFNHTLESLWRINLLDKRLFLALLRWEDDGSGRPGELFGPRADSQDAWIVHRDAITFEPTEDEFGFPFGKSGCDNAIALLMLRKKFLVANPAYTIQGVHLHSTNIRNYDPKDVLYKPFYLYVEPTAIQQYRVLSDLSDRKAPPSVAKDWSKRLLRKSFQRPIHGVRDEEVEEFCKHLRHSGEPYLANEDNLWTPTPVQSPLYNFKGGCFSTPSGLVMTFKDLCVGRHETWVSAWQSAAVSNLTMSIHVPNMLAIPCDTATCGKSLAQWVLNYLPTALSVRSIVRASGHPAPEFLVPQLNDIGSFLTDCAWTDEPKRNITVVPLMEDATYYSGSLWAVPPQDGARVCAEDIDLLRKLLPESESKTLSLPVAVFCVQDDEDAVCTRGWAEETADKILPKGWIVHYVSTSDFPSVRRKAFQQASWIIGAGESLDWMWYARPGTTLMEFSDARTVGAAAGRVHLAGAANLRYVHGSIRGESIVFQRQNALLDVGAAIKKHGFKEMLNAIRGSSAAEKPRIVLPDGAALEGIHNHPGNGFRALVKLWEARGYVTVETSTHTPFCWWGGIGDVLLYDRPTSRWWHDISTYKMALFGGCAPPGPETHVLRQSVWSYWTNDPQVYEDLAETLRNYKSRKTAALFIGSAKNGLQKAARAPEIWSSCVDVFRLDTDVSTSNARMDPHAYALELCNARYGLVLPGTGQKSTRVIEYFACGCVPIVTEGVDMAHFLVPPIEGIHYLRAKTPEDVKRIVAETSPEKWTMLSAAGRNWWRMYASAEGLFRLTWSRIEQCKPYYGVGIPRQYQLL